MEFGDIISYLKTRPCTDNIKKYQQELNDMRIMTGIQNMNVSHTHLHKQMAKVSSKLRAISYEAYQHRLLNTYIHHYKDKLCLANDTQNPLANDFTLTIDFSELNELKQATEQAGFDPYTHYMKVRRIQTRQKQDAVQAQVECGIREKRDDEEQVLVEKRRDEYDDQREFQTLL